MLANSADLAQSGLKATLPRLKILDLFRQSTQRHLAAEDVYRLLVAEQADFGLATVYRVLSQFEQTGVLKKSQLGNGRAVFELNDGQQHHGHLVCTVTGEVHEFFDPEIEARLRAIAAERGLLLADYVVTAFGAPG
ncbi:transcriptional repressor [Variovorax ginsengisoli]|uniref:Ferric uptake regulation protein n=1 Tax=Variovorax ginsengisoli TaxID=363844 RepID=A0ABT9SD12_9BURK|nr:transcriptional repressor [Variovorax ginsengisoli]MDP9902247.1 Fur family ferric uptake transcriptional regulator [Variovorax ginsengisoli]